MIESVSSYKLLEKKILNRKCSKAEVMCQADFKARVPNILASATSFMEDNFSMDQGTGRVVSGWFKCITFIVHFISIIVISVPLQIIRHLIPEAEDPCFKNIH